MPSNILARADALMQRRRQSNGDADDVPVLRQRLARLQSAGSPRLH